MTEDEWTMRNRIENDTRDPKPTFAPKVCVHAQWVAL
jgi:hypothetical protein